jgi:hypothetical protein
MLEYQPTTHTTKKMLINNFIGHFAVLNLLPYIHAAYNSQISGVSSRVAVL